MKELPQAVTTKKLEEQLKDFLQRHNLVDGDTASVKKPCSEYKYPIKPNPLINNMKAGPKT